MKTVLRRIARLFPPVRAILDDREAMSRELESWRSQFKFAPGHYYSPIPSAADVSQEFSRQRSITDMPGIDLNVAGQAEIFSAVKAFYPTQPFDEEATSTNRYGFNNQAFCYSDAISLQAILRHFQPRRVVEIGSGYSSAVMLDVNQQFLNESMQLTFIDPYPDRLNRLVRDADRSRVDIIEKRLQDLKTEPWNALRTNDILFIDSSHVSKCGSDVNQIYFQIVPSLAPGVIVHVHDIFPGFEYPRDWVESRGWNEAYLLRAFLQFNRTFEILFWVPFMVEQRIEECRAELPLMAKNSGGSIWLRKRDVFH